MSTNRNNTGFTLIEMLVALAMIATIVSIVYGSYAATSKSLEVYDNRLSCSQRAQLVLRLMTRQIRCAYAPAEPNNSESLSSQIGEARETTSRTGTRKPAVVFRGDPHNKRGEILQFMTTAGLGDNPAAPQRLSYTKYRYDRSTMTLSIDRGTCAGPLGPEGSASHWQSLLDRVEGIDLAFHDGRQWRQEWDSAQDKGLPRAVRIGLTVVDENGREYCVGTTASIGCRITPSQPTSRQSTADMKR